MQEFKQNLIVALLVLLGVVEVFSLFVSVPNQSGESVISTQNQNGESAAVAPVLKLSEIRGPRIDDQAATIVVDQTKACFTLPMDVWLFLLLAYVALLIFNFSYTFERATKPQWFLEVGLTALAIAAWYVWDDCRTNVWFPFAVVKLGLLVYILYLYLLEKKLLEKGEKEKTESLF